MTDTELVRTLIADSLQYGVSSAVGDADTTEYLLTNSTVYPNSQVVRVAGSVKTIVTDYIIDNDIGLLTFLTAPINGADIEVSFKFSLLSDAQIVAIMGQYQDDPVKLGAADCLDAIATSEALIQKKIRSLDIQTDGPAVADSLRKTAQALRLQVSDTSEAFDIAESIYDRASRCEYILKNILMES